MKGLWHTDVTVRAAHSLMSHGVRATKFLEKRDGKGDIKPGQGRAFCGKGH
jgi:hypothetical protein